MRIAADHYVNGARPAGAAEQHPCVEIRSEDGTVWANVFLGKADAPAKGQIVRAEGAKPEATSLIAHSSGLWPTVPLDKGAQISARPGWPRLIIEAPPAS